MTKNLNYLVELTYDKDYKGFVANVVNLYGCMSQGKTKKEALANVKKAINAYMEAVGKKDGKVEKEIINVPISISSL